MTTTINTLTIIVSDQLPAVAVVPADVCDDGLSDIIPCRHLEDFAFAGSAIGSILGEHFPDADKLEVDTATEIDPFTAKAIRRAQNHAQDALRAEFDSRLAAVRKRLSSHFWGRFRRSIEDAEFAEAWRMVALKLEEV
mgnify:FL=1